MSSSRPVKTRNRTITIDETGPVRRLLEFCRIEVPVESAFPRLERKRKTALRLGVQDKPPMTGSSEEAVQTARAIGYPGGLGSCIRREQ